MVFGFFKKKKKEEQQVVVQDNQQQDNIDVIEAPTEEAIEIGQDVSVEPAVFFVSVNTAPDGTDVAIV